MSGLDNSQPITDAAVLRDDDDEGNRDETTAAKGVDEAQVVDAEELGDATPGPR